jgi:hypothetical protein
MGGAIRVERLMDALQEGLSRYRAHQADGADMAQAGAELFSYLEDVTTPRACSPSRYSILGMVVRDNDPESLQDMKEIILETAVPGQDVQKVFGVIDERIALLQETDPDYPPSTHMETIVAIPLDDY